MQYTYSAFPRLASVAADRRWRLARLAILSLVVLLVLNGVAMMAQERFGTISGVVTDSTKASIPGVKVTVTNREIGKSLSTTSRTDGTYILRELEPGRYVVRFERTGFTAAEVADVNLLVGKELRIDQTLSVGSTTETVQVTESAPLIDFSSPKIAHNVTAEEFDRLPKPRSFQQLALTSTSVNSGEVEGGFQVNGASGAENQFTIDGVSTTSLINGKSRQNAMFEILQEVQVKTGGVDAEYGGAMGGVISAITKSGGNAFHGDLHYYLSGNSISAGPVKRLLLDPSDEKTVSYVQDSKFKNDGHEIGGSLGGRLIKDKLFFFSAFSPRFQRESRDYLFSSGREPGKLTRDSDYWMMFHKLSWEPTQRVRTNFTYLWSPTMVNGTLLSYSVGPNQSSQTLTSAGYNQAIGTFSPQSSYTGQVDVTTSNTTMLTFRAGRFWDNYKTVGIPGQSSVEYGSSATNLPFAIPDALKQPSGYSNIPRRLNTFHDLATRTYFQMDGSAFFRGLGTHDFKAGWGISKTVNNVLEAYPGQGYVRIFWNSTFNSPTLGRNTGQYGYYEVNNFGTGGTTGGTMQNYYFRDQWRIIPRLTVTLGLRLENEHVPSFRRDIRDNAFSFGFGDKIAPRLGASFDIFGDGRVKIYGSFGRTFDWVKYELSRGTFGAQFWKIDYRTLDTLDVLSLSGTNKPGRNIWAADPNSQRDRRIPAFDLVDPGVKPMSSDLYNIGTEFQLAPQTVLRVGYVHNNLRRTIEDLGALDADGNEVYLYGNPGEGKATIQPTSGLTKPFPMPKPVRKYDALEVQLTRRFAKSYFASASYVYSRLYGNYAGLANSDEITLPTTNVGSGTAQQLGGSVSRQGGNANRSWDLDEILFDSKGTVDIKGRLNTDRPHVIKLYGAKEFKWGTNVGLFFYGGSGTPVSTLVNTTNQIPVFVNGRGDLGRTPILTQTDLNVFHDFKIGETKRLRFEMNMQNLFNQKTARQIFPYVNRGAGTAVPSSGIDLHGVDLTKGYDYKALIALTPDASAPRGALDPRFLKQDLFNPGFAGRFGIKFVF
ncbi:MAG: TonB-dependent receptor [Bryobacterales bacterium]|nr:TonB-dependent receptor [Bryobacterales bacterium]